MQNLKYMISGKLISQLTGIALLSALCINTKASEVQSSHAYENILAWDMHLHAGSFEAMGPLGQKFLLDTLPDFLPDTMKKWSLSQVSKLTLNPYTPILGIKAQAKLAGLQHAGILGLYAPRTWGDTTNEQVDKWMYNHKNKLQEDGKKFFFGLAGVPVEDDWENKKEEHLERLRMFLQKDSFVGIKLAFIHTGTSFADKSYEGIYQIASEEEVPVYHHTGSSPLRKLGDFSTEEERQQYINSADPKKLQWAFIKYPDVPFILGHMGYNFNKDSMDYMVDTLNLAEKYPNVYLEISGFGTKHHDPEGSAMDFALTEIKKRNLITKTLYGSDVTGVPGKIKEYLERTKTSLFRCGYSFEEAELVLSGNASRIFRY